MLKGIDISKWQAGINLPAIANQIDFVICKATEGVGYTDKNCDGFYQQAKSLGKKLGVYHFARPDLGNSAVAEADYFVKETLGYHKKSILILDWEPAGNSINNVAWAKAWLDRVYEKTGVKPLIYMSASVMRDNDWSSVANADYGLWVANYGTNNGSAQEVVFTKYPLKYWSFYALWQYTSKGRLKGYNGNLDLNYFSGDQTAWDKYAGGKPSASKPTTPSKSVYELAKEVIAGKWGNGDAREKALTEAGYNYREVQDKVNEILYGSSSPIKAGDSVIVNGVGTASANGTGINTRKYVNQRMKVIAIKEGSKHPYACNQHNSGIVGNFAYVTAWFSADSVRKG